jgi:NitT/TauT family transport system ATP-binding protein
MLDVRAVSKTYAGQRGPVVALLPTSFHVAEGEFVSLLGPSGCGKSTALHIVAGLEDPTSGQVHLDGKLVLGPDSERGMVFQSYTLFPWLTVMQNACFSTELGANEKRGAAKERKARAAALLELMGLADFLGAYPKELSGGMKQRVAIVRALVNGPKLLSMDEPFGALDAQTREEMQELTLLLREREKTTTLFVTHDIEEALYLSTRVLVFSPRPGRIIEDLTVPFGPSAARTEGLKLSGEFIDLKRSLFALLHPGERAAARRRALLDALVSPAEERS